VVLYVSAEETEQQVASRGHRMGLTPTTSSCSPPPASRYAPGAPPHGSLVFCTVLYCSVLSDLQDWNPDSLAGWLGAGPAYLKCVL